MVEEDSDFYARLYGTARAAGRGGDVAAILIAVEARIAAYESILGGAARPAAKSPQDEARTQLAGLTSLRTRIVLESSGQPIGDQVRSRPG